MEDNSFNFETFQTVGDMFHLIFIHYQIKRFLLFFIHKLVNIIVYKCMSPYFQNVHGCKLQAERWRDLHIWLCKPIRYSWTSKQRQEAERSVGNRRLVFHCEVWEREENMIVNVCNAQENRDLCQVWVMSQLCESNGNLIYFIPFSRNHRWQQK